METDRARCSDGRQLVRNAAAGYSDASGRKRHGCCRWWVTGLQQPGGIGPPPRILPPRGPPRLEHRIIFPTEAALAAAAYVLTWALMPQVELDWPRLTISS